MDECREILESCYPCIGAPVSIEEGGGTAGHCWRIATQSGRYLLRRRGKRTSEPNLVQRDHAFRHFLVAGGIPTTCALPGRDGECFFISNGFAYELHPFVEGRFMRANSDEELRNLAVCAELIVRSAQKRHESRGLHYTLDYPKQARRPKQTVLEGYKG